MIMCSHRWGCVESQDRVKMCEGVVWGVFLWYNLAVLQGCGNSEVEDFI